MRWILVGVIGRELVLSGFLLENFSINNVAIESCPISGRSAWLRILVSVFE